MRCTLLLGLFLGTMSCAETPVASQAVIESYCEVVDTRQPDGETARFYGCDNPYAALAYVHARGVRGGELRARVVYMRRHIGRQYGEWVEYPWKGRESE